jgi:hypothetical protein
MQPVAASTKIPSATPSTPSPEDGPRAGGGVQGAIGDLLRGGAAGYQTAAHMSAVQTDKAAIVPFETVITATSLLKDKTAHIKFVGKGTGLLNTIAGFGMLILASNVSSGFRSPGDTVADLAGHVADAIDGKDTTNGWSVGWGVRSEAGVPDSVATSALGASLANAGMK